MTTRMARDLDCDVLRAVYGVKKIHFEEWDSEKAFPLFIPSGKPWRTHQIDAESVPAFSVDINEAMKAVLKLGLNWRGFDFHIRKDATADTWEAGWYEADPSGWERRAVVDAETPALAICLAALAAVEASQ